MIYSLNSLLSVIDSNNGQGNWYSLITTETWAYLEY